MKTKTLLALGVSSSLAAFAPAALAEDNDAIVDASANSNIAAMIPAKSEGITYHPDGSMSAQVGLDKLKYLVAVRNEEGELVLTHQKTDDVNLDESALNTEEEEE